PEPDAPRLEADLAQEPDRGEQQEARVDQPQGDRRLSQREGALRELAHPSLGARPSDTPRRAAKRAQMRAATKQMGPHRRSALTGARRKPRVVCTPRTSIQHTSAPMRRATSSTAARPRTRSAVEIASAAAPERAMTVTCARRATGCPVRGSTTSPAARPRTRSRRQSVEEVEQARSLSVKVP